MPPKKSYDCPICGQYMDFFAITYKNDPYIDGQTYRRMCFGCAHVPKEYVQKCDAKGNLLDQLGPFYTYKRLHGAKELHDEGATETFYKAQQCVRSVKTRLAKVGKKKLDKLKLKRPQQEYEMNDEYEEAQIKKQGKKK